jgi:hypothetical protein
MQEQSKSRPALGEGPDVLEWMGTAYGRRGHSDSNAHSAQEVTPARTLAATAGHKRRVIVVLVGFFVIVFATALLQVRGSASLSGVTRTAKSIPSDAPQKPGVSKSTENTTLHADIERASHEAKAQLASEHQARIALEGQVAQLTSELAAQTRDRENAERAGTATRAELAADRKARAEAEGAAKSSKEALARVASCAAPARVTPTPAPQKTVLAEPEPVEPSPLATARVTDASVGPSANSDAANAALLEGQKLFAEGDLKSARQRFERAAQLGLPEGALALGNTYDPVSLAKAGMKLTGDPPHARQWYRRAYELAQSHQEPQR